MKNLILLAASSFPFLAFTAAPSAPAPAPAQEAALEFPQASPPSFVRNRVGLTTVEIEYARPSVRGRTIYGGLVPYGEVWRTGANAATKVTFDTEVTFGGETVPAGTYALFTIPGENEWKVILNKNVEQWGSYGYDEGLDVARISAAATKLAQPVETLTINVGSFDGGDAKLTIDWASTRVSVDLETDIVALMKPRIEAAMSADGDQKPYLQAAMFYYENDLDIGKAKQWIEAGAKQQPDAVWLVYRKALILEKAGDKAAALETAKRAAELAKKQGGELGAEYGRLSAALIAKLEG